MHTNDRNRPVLLSRRTASATRIYMLDLVTGPVVEREQVGHDGLNCTNAKMTHSFPGNITVLDTERRRLADRMYAARHGRTDLALRHQERQPCGALVTGGVLASLGSAAVRHRRQLRAEPPLLLRAGRRARSRRAARRRYINIAIGSGTAVIRSRTDAGQLLFDPRLRAVRQAHPDSYNVAEAI